MTTDADKTILQMSQEMKAIQGEEYVRDYDLNLLHDMDEVEGSTEDQPKWRTSYAVGWQEDLSAGIRGGTVSPWFPTSQEAYAWCYDNLGYIEGIMNGGEK